MGKSSRIQAGELFLESASLLENNKWAFAEQKIEEVIALYLAIPSQELTKEDYVNLIKYCEFAKSIYEDWSSKSHDHLIKTCGVKKVLLDLQNELCNLTNTKLDPQKLEEMYFSIAESHWRIVKLKETASIKDMQEAQKYIELAISVATDASAKDKYKKMEKNIIERLGPFAQNKIEETDMLRNKKYETDRNIAMSFKVASDQLKQKGYTAQAHQKLEEAITKLSLLLQAYGMPREDLALLRDWYSEAVNFYVNNKFLHKTHTVFFYNQLEKIGDISLQLDEPLEAYQSYLFLKNALTNDVNIPIRHYSSEELMRRKMRLEAITNKINNIIIKPEAGISLLKKLTDIQYENDKLHVEVAKLTDENLELRNQIATNAIPTNTKFLNLGGVFKIEPKNKITSVDNKSHHEVAERPYRHCEEAERLKQSH